MTKRYAPFLLAYVVHTTSWSQVLVDSIPYPSLSQGFWGIHVNADTLFLGDDFSGNIFFSDHGGNILGQGTTGFSFDHGLVKRPASYLIAQDYTSNGAHLYEVALDGSLLNTWTFPDVIGGHSSGIGDICVDGNAIWYTMYYPDFDVYPYAYAYKWVPGDPTPIDTVPLQGDQPYGIALKGDTLLYVTDDLDGDDERIYAYDLTDEQDLGSVDLPDPDGDQSPRGLFYDGELLYLIANRSGGSAFAYQTIFIYAFDATTAVTDLERHGSLRVWPSPTEGTLFVQSDLAERTSAELRDALGRVVRQLTLAPGTQPVDMGSLSPGTYVLRGEGLGPVRMIRH